MQFRISVIGYEEAIDTSSSYRYTLYRTTIIYKNEIHERLFRFSAFHAFYKSLRERKRSTIAFPNRTWNSKKRLSIKTLNERCTQLHNVMVSLSNMSESLSESSKEKVLAFFQLEHYTQNVMSVPAKWWTMPIRILRCIQKSKCRKNNEYGNVKPDGDEVVGRETVNLDHSQLREKHADDVVEEKKKPAKIKEVSAKIEERKVEVAKESESVISSKVASALENTIGMNKSPVSTLNKTNSPIKPEVITVSDTKQSKIASLSEMTSIKENILSEVGENAMTLSSQIAKQEARVQQLCAMDEITMEESVDSMRQEDVEEKIKNALLKVATMVSSDASCDGTSIQTPSEEGRNEKGTGEVSLPMDDSLVLSKSSVAHPMSA